MRRFHAANVHAPFRNHVVKLYERGLKLFLNRGFNFYIKKSFSLTIIYSIEIQTSAFFKMSVLYEVLLFASKKRILIPEQYKRYIQVKKVHKHKKRPAEIQDPVDIEVKKFSLNNTKNHPATQQFSFCLVAGCVVQP